MRALASDEDIIEGAAEDISAVQGSIDDDESKIMEEFGAAPNKAQWKIKIYKVGEGGKRGGWVIDIAPSELPYLAKLRALAGHGSYSGWCYNGQSKSPKRVIKWEISELIAPPAGPSSSDSALAQAVAGIMSIQKDLVREIATMKAAPAAPAAPQSSMSEMMNSIVGMMKMLKSESPPPPPPPPPAPDQFAMLTSVVSLAKELASDGKEKSMLEVVAEIFQSPVVQETLRSVNANQQQQPRPGAPGRPAPPSLAAPHPGASQPVAPAAQPLPFAAEMEFLLQGARKDIDPVSFADVALGIIDEVTMAQLLAMPDPIGLLIQANPNVEPFRKWFGEFFEALTDDGGEDDIPPHAVRRNAPSLAPDNDSGRGGGGKGDSEADDDEGEAG